MQHHILGHIHAVQNTEATLSSMILLINILNVAITIIKYIRSEVNSSFETILTSFRQAYCTATHDFWLKPTCTGIHIDVRNTSLSTDLTQGEQKFLYIKLSFQGCDFTWNTQHCRQPSVDSNKHRPNKYKNFSLKMIYVNVASNSICLSLQEQWLD